MAKLNGSLLLLAMIVSMVSLVASTNPPQPTIPPSWSALFSISINNLTEVSTGTLYVNNPNTIRLDQEDSILIAYFDKGYGYYLNATSDQDQSLSCTSTNIYQQSGGSIFDFSKASYVSTTFSNGTSQDLWTGVIFKDIGGS